MLSKREKNIIQGLIKGNKTQPIVDYKECLFEQVFVETPVDTDGDGKLDLIAVYIRRPKETLEGYKVPAIYVANPYMMSCNEEGYIPYNVDKDLKVFPQQNINKKEILYDFSVDKRAIAYEARETKGFAETSEIEEIELDCITDWYSYFNSRGYASVFCGGLGTRGSEGVTLSGSREEILGFKSVIDWLNGRCRAFTNKTDNIEIKAEWCTGNVAMSGKSYLGTMCIGVATTGVEGLKTIIPEAAISNWFAYDRYNGLNVPPLGWQGDDITLLSNYCCSRVLDEADYLKIKDSYENALNIMAKKQDRISGNYNEFWDERNYLNLVDNIKASVFIVHGINDWNVKMNQSIPLWKELVKRDLPRRMMLHQGAHVYIHNLEGSNFNKILHQWMDYWLYEIDNGIQDKKSEVFVQSNLDQGVWFKSEEWGTHNCKKILFPIANKSKRTFVDNLDATKYSRKKNNLSEWQKGVVLEDNNYSLKYLWNPKEEIRICGTINVEFNAAIDKPTAILSAMLVDFGREYRLIETQEIAEKDGIVWGKNTPIDDEMRFMSEKEPSEYKIITRGWMNAQNRTCNWSKDAIQSDMFYKYNFDMIPTDYTVKMGHQVGLILYSTDPESTERPFVVTNITIDQESIVVEIPLMLC